MCNSLQLLGNRQMHICCIKTLHYIKNYFAAFDTKLGNSNNSTLNQALSHICVVNFTQPDIAINIFYNQKVLARGTLPYGIVLSFSGTAAASTPNYQQLGYTKIPQNKNYPDVPFKVSEENLVLLQQLNEVCSFYNGSPVQPCEMYCIELVI